MAERALLGWRTQSPQAALAFPPPEMLPPEAAARAGLYAGASTALAPRLIQFRAAFDLRLSVSPPAIRPVRFTRVEEPGCLSEQGFKGLVSFIVPSAQRDPATPAVQISLNMHLVSDQPCRLTLMPPVLDPTFRDWPGTLVCGRFPLEAWPRPLNAILEWQDRDCDWVIRRGAPLAYVMIEYDDPAVRPQLVEAAATPALARHLKMVDAVSDFARNVGPMFAEAARRRPARLVVAKSTGAPPWDGPGALGG